MQKLTSSSTPFVNRGQRARWHAEIYVVFRAFCHPDPWSQVTREIPYGHPCLSLAEGNEFSADHFQKFCRFLLSSFENIQAQRRTRFFSAGRGRSTWIVRGNIVVIPFYCFQDTEVLLTLLMPFLSFWMTGSAGWDIDRPNDVPLKRN